MLLVAVLAGLAALVFSFYPGHSAFKPAPLVPHPPGCAKTAAAFVPTNATGIPIPELASLPAGARSRVLYQINMHPCSCGCNQSIIACRVRDPECATSRELLHQLTDASTNPQQARR